MTKKRNDETFEDFTGGHVMKSQGLLLLPVYVEFLHPIIFSPYRSKLCFSNIMF